MLPSEKPTPPPSTERLALQKRMADLCQAQPPAFAEVVRYADHLRNQSVERGDAYRQARAAIRYCHRRSPGAP